MTNVSILGAGAFGTALAVYAGGLGHRVRVWAFDDGLPEAVAAQGENSLYLPGFPVSEEIGFTNEIAEALAEADRRDQIDHPHLDLVGRCLEDDSLVGMQRGQFVEIDFFHQRNAQTPHDSFKCCPNTVNTSTNHNKVVFLRCQLFKRLPNLRVGVHYFSKQILSKTDLSTYEKP